MTYCAPLGIPHSVFLGRVWPNPKDPSEPYWLDEDRDLALAYGRATREICKTCGTRPEEWEHDPNAYLGDIDYCEGCARLAAEEDNMPEEPERKRGLRARLLPRLEAMRRLAEGKGTGE